MPRLFKHIAYRLMERAAKTPYYHLGNYMERYWLVPYIREGSHSAVGKNGVGPVKFRERPIAWFLQKLDIAARVHHILRSDDDRAFHDHPWPYVSVVLFGGYWEITPKFDKAGNVVGSQRKWYGPGSIIFRKARSWHILELEPGTSAWTLFITGKYAQGWGFLVAGEKIPYKTYLGIEEKDHAEG